MMMMMMMMVVVISCGLTGCVACSWRQGSAYVAGLLQRLAGTRPAQQGENGLHVDRRQRRSLWLVQRTMRAPSAVRLRKQ